MKTPAIIASLTVIGSIAYAAGSQGVAGKQSPPMPSGSQMHSMQEEMPQARMAQMATACPRGDDKNWFTIVHPLPECAICPPVLSVSLSAGVPVPDVNADGTLDYIQGGCAGWMVWDGAVVSGSFADLSEISGAGDNCIVTVSSVARSEPVGAFVKSRYPAAVRANAGFSFRDMDNDGDMDMLLSIYIDFGTAAEIYRSAWLENTGYEKPAQPIAADLNGDGQVNGADLGLLLVAWGPNP